MIFKIKEIRRKTFHLVSGLIIFILIYLNIFDVLSLSLIFLISFLCSFISRYIKIPILYFFLEKFDRDNDIRKFPGKGAVLFILGILLSILIFSKNIALASILILSFGDSLSLLFGVHFGFTSNPLNKKKSIEGTMIGIVVASIAASFFVGFFSAFCAAVSAMFFESLELKSYNNIILDDNLTIPLVSGLVIYIVNLL